MTPQQRLRDLDDLSFWLKVLIASACATGLIACWASIESNMHILLQLIAIINFGLVVLMIHIISHVREEIHELQEQDDNA